MAKRAADHIQYLGTSIRASRAEQVSEVKRACCIGGPARYLGNVASGEHTLPTSW